jgi:hypothetical protein
MVRIEMEPLENNNYKRLTNNAKTRKRLPEKIIWNKELNTAIFPR